jgi:hypothetical protein
MKLQADMISLEGNAVCSRTILMREGTMRTCPVDKRKKSPRSNVLPSMNARTLASIKGRSGSSASKTRLCAGFVEMQVADCQAGAGCRKERAEAACFFRIGEVQHAVDRVCRMAASALPDAAGAMLEGASKPW